MKKFLILFLISSLVLNIHGMTHESHKKQLHILKQNFKIKSSCNDCCSTCCLLLPGTVFSSVTGFGAGVACYQLCPNSCDQIGCSQKTVTSVSAVIAPLFYYTCLCKKQKIKVDGE